MRSRLLINLVLLLVVTGLSLLLIYDQNEQSVITETPLTALDPAGITRIHIERGEGSVVSFNRDRDGWYMQRPYIHAANPVRISAMLKLLQAHSYTQFRTADVDLARFLLKAPAVVIQFDDTRIAFGDSSPIGKQRYVLVNDTVHLINDSLFQQLQAPATFFLNSRLLLEAAKIQSITLPGHTISKQNDIWSIVPATDISADQIVQLVDAWHNLNAISISEYMPGNNYGMISIDMGDAGIINLSIVSPPPQLILGREDLGLQYHISDDDAARLFLAKVNEITESAEQAE